MTEDISAIIGKLAILKVEIGKKRDQLRELAIEVEDMLDSTERGFESLGIAIDELSELV